MSDARWMSSALRLARRGLGRTSPNPPVGAVIVAADGTLVGRGWHRRAGEAHAEVMALEQAVGKAFGATLYCTLEPCCHHGRTGACAEAIIAAGIRRVVYGVTDPDPRCAGGGGERLRQAGLSVWREPLRGQLDELYEPYIKHKTSGRPFVTLKLAMTLDGQAAMRLRDPVWLTGSGAKDLVRRWRDASDAVMVGVGTVLIDNPQLTVRPQGKPDRYQPLRVVADTMARTPPGALVVTGPGACLIAVGPEAPCVRVRALREAGAEVVQVSASEKHVSLPDLLAHLGARGVMSVLCEGGPELAAGLVREELVNKYQFFYAPKIMGDQGLPAIGSLWPDGMVDLVMLKLGADPRRVDEDLLVTAYPRDAARSAIDDPTPCSPDS